MIQPEAPPARRARVAPALAALLLPLAGSGLASAQDPGADPGQERVLELTLEDALRIALENNLDLELEVLITEISRYDFLGSWGAFDPIYSLSGTLSETDREAESSLVGTEFSTQRFDTSIAFPLTTGGLFDVTYSRDNLETDAPFAAFDVSTTDIVTVALTQPLLRGAWKRFATSDQREAGIDLARQEARLKEVRHRVLLDVYIAYWDLVAAVEELGVREFALELGGQQLEQNRRRLEVGVGTEVDVLQAETNMAQQEEDRLRAEFNLRAAEDVLRTLIFQRREGDILDEARVWDWPVIALTPLPEVPEAVGLEWLPSLDRALRHRPELEQQRLEIDASEVRLVRASSLRLPGLDLTVSATGRGFDTQPTDAFDEAVAFDFPTYTGTLSFDVPLRNRSARNAELAARTAVRTARIGYEQIELAVLAGVRSAVRDVFFASEAVQAAETSRDFARRQLEAEQARYEEGLSTTFQVLEFQRDLAEALSTLTTVHGSYAKAVAGLKHAEGLLGTEPPGE